MKRKAEKQASIRVRILNTLHEMRFTKALLRSWFELTGSEQKAVIIVLALFMLGLAVRYLHIHARLGSLAARAYGQAGH